MTFENSQNASLASEKSVMKTLQRISVFSLAFFLYFPHANANYIRIEIGADITQKRVPQTFSALIDHLTANNYQVMWPDGPYYDPSATMWGAGEIGGITIIIQSDELYVTWIRTDELQAAELTEEEMISLMEPNVGIIRDGNVVIIVRSYSNNRLFLEEILDAIQF